MNRNTASAVICILLFIFGSGDLLSGKQEMDDKMAIRAKVNPKQLNFGEISPGVQSVSSEFAILNTGTIPIVVKSVKPSCHCTIPRLDEKVISPGKSGIVNVALSLYGISGEYASSVALVFEDNSYILVPLLVYIKNTVLVSPETIRGNFRVGENTYFCAAILSKSLPKNGVVTGVTFQDERNVMCNLKKNGNTIREKEVYEVWINLSKMSSGTHEGFLTFRWGDGEKTTLPYSIFMREG